MGQFKPMVKMMTTEPTVELKLKKGGSVSGHKNMKSGGCMKSGGKADASGHSYMNGGISAALAGEPMIATKRSSSAPKMGKPSMAARRAAMKATGRGKANGGAMEALKKHEDKPASKAHKGLKTGGVVKGQGGYKTGGVVKGQGGYKEGGVIKSTAGVSKVNTAKPDNSPAKTGDVALGKAGGYKKGGSTGKKMAMGGMPIRPLTTNKPSAPSKPTGGLGGLGRNAETDSKNYRASLGLYGKDAEAASKPVNFPKLSGPSMGGVMPTKETRASFQNTGNLPVPRKPSRIMKKGGSSKKFAEGGSVQDDGRPQRMPQGAKKPSSPVTINQLSGTFKKGGKVKKYAEGGMSDYESEMSPQERMKEMRMRKAMEEGYEGTRKRDTMANEALLESISSLPTAVKNMIRKAMRGQGAVTDAETTVSRTVVPPSNIGTGPITREEREFIRKSMPAKKRGGKVCK